MKTLGLILLSLCLCFVGPLPAAGHSREITSCKGNIPYKEAKQIGSPYVLDSNGLIAEDYDTNGDGKPDVTAYSHPDGTKHKPHPVFWAVDLNYDGLYDFIYIDKKGLGKCTDIVLYEDLNKPTGLDPRKPYHADRGGNL